MEGDSPHNLEELRQWFSVERRGDDANTAADYIAAFASTNPHGLAKVVLELYDDGKITPKNEFGKTVLACMLRGLERRDAVGQKRIARRIVEDYRGEMSRVAEAVVYLALSVTGFPYMYYPAERFDEAYEKMDSVISRYVLKRAYRRCREDMGVAIHLP